MLFDELDLFILNENSRDSNSEEALALMKKTKETLENGGMEMKWLQEIQLERMHKEARSMFEWVRYCAQRRESAGQNGEGIA